VGPVFVQRTLGRVLRRSASQFPAVVVTGARQAGKTTLVRATFGASHGYLSMDDPEARELALRDPVLLLARHPRPLILDEIQYAPSVLHAVKRDIDEHRSDRGRFVLTGSQIFTLMAGVSESLAGRVAVLQLLGLSLGERTGMPQSEREPGAMIAGLGSARAAGGLTDPDEIGARLLAGGYPEPALFAEADPGFDHRLWHGSYVQTYLERDVRSLRAVGDLQDFQRLLFALAARSATLFNASDLGRDLGITHHTVKAWLSVLEASGQTFTLRPYLANLGQRVVKRPKIYFLDTGTLSYLLRLRSAEQVLDGPAAGQLFETAVLGELVRLFAHRGEVPPLSFWRTAAGAEVDFVVDLGDRLVPVEAKLTATPNPRHAEPIERFQALAKRRAAHGYVVCLCRQPIPLSRTVTAVPLGALAASTA